MSLFDIIDQHERHRPQPPAIATGKVVDNRDPEHVGRVRVRYEWRRQNDESGWIRVMTPMAGKQKGVYFLPEIGDEVVVAFQNGDIDSPVVMGALWSKDNKPPEGNEDGGNNVRMIQSRGGHKIVLDDRDGAEKIAVTDKSGNSIVIDSKENLVSITGKKDIRLSAAGKITISADEVEIKSTKGTAMESGADFSIKASSQGSFEASAAMTIKASGNTVVKGAMVMIN